MESILLHNTRQHRIISARRAKLRDFTNKVLLAIAAKTSTQYMPFFHNLFFAAAIDWPQQKMGGHNDTHYHS